MNQPNPVKKLALLGMGKRSATVFSQLLQQFTPSFCEIVSIDEAEIVLLDLDGEGQQKARDLLQKSYSQLAVIAISIQIQKIENMCYLRKPLSMQKLSDLVQQINTKNYKKAAGDSIAINESTNKISSVKQGASAVANGLLDRVHVKRRHSDPYTNSDDMFFDPAKYVLSYVLKAIDKSKKTKSQIVVKLWDEKTILVDAEHGKILTDISTSKIRALGVIKVDKRHTPVHIKAADPKLKFDFNPRFSNVIRISTIDQFVWQLAYITCRGRLPKYLADDVVFNLQAAVFINEWPNFTRMEPIPHAISTVAFWIQNPITIGRLSSLLHVEDKDINSLFFACFSIGIAGQDRRRGDNITGQDRRRGDNMDDVSHKTKHKHRSIFRAILSHLKVG